MDKRKKANIAIAAFLTACLIPSVGMFVLPAAPIAANQTLSPPPKLLKDGKINFVHLRETENFVNDYIAFRQEMITIFAKLNAKIFHVSTADKILLGKKDWLFYQETLADVLHTEPLTDRQLYSAAHTIALLKDYVSPADFFITIAPNKASLYIDYFPSMGTPLSGESNTERLIPLLKSEDITYIDLFTPFRNQEDILYYHTDSHWNTRGAALAHDTIMNAMGREDHFFLGTYHDGASHKGDLYEMLYPAGTYQEPDTEFDRPFTFSYTKKFHSPEDQRIETENMGKDGNLFMFRDSFGNSLYSFMADSFKTAHFFRAMPYQMSLLDGLHKNEEGDTVVIEIVERNLEWLAEKAPIFPAPERFISDTPIEGDASVILQKVEDELLSGYVRIEGTLSGAIDTDSPIYLQLGNTLYEASPVGADWTEVPFTLYIEESALTDNPAVLYRSDGILHFNEAVISTK